jgi:hypothetical protein
MCAPAAGGGGRYNRQRPPRNTQEKPAEDVVPVTELKQHTKVHAPAFLPAFQF